MALVFTFIFLQKIKAFSQSGATDFCNFTVTASLQIKEKLKISGLSIRGVKQHEADKIIKLLNIKRDEELYIHHDSLCNRLKSAGIYKNYYLSSIEFYSDTTAVTKDAAIVRFKFDKIKH